MRILLDYLSYYQLFNADCFVNLLTVLYTVRVSLVHVQSLFLFTFCTENNLPATEGVKLIKNGHNMKREIIIIIITYLLITYLRTYLHTYSLTHSLTHLLSYLFTYLLTYLISYLFTHLLITY